MMTVHFGWEVNDYKDKVRRIAKYFLANKQIRVNDPERASSAAIRHMIDEVYVVLPEEYKNELKKSE